MVRCYITGGTLLDNNTMGSFDQFEDVLAFFLFSFLLILPLYVQRHYQSMSLYRIHPQMSIKRWVPVTCVESKGDKTADIKNELKVHGVSVLYSEKVK